MRNLLLASVIFLSSCTDVPVENQNDSTVFDSLASIDNTRSQKPTASVLDTVALKSNSSLTRQDSAKIAEAMEKVSGNDWAIMDTMTGDLNRDNYMDMLVVLQSDAKFVATDEPRPLLILIGAADGELKLVEQNDYVVMCEDCGGVWGDPYDGLAIKNGYFSVEHFGGSSWKWTKIITFKYNVAEGTWFLHRDAGDSFNAFEPDSVTHNVFNQELFGKTKFTDYVQ